MRRAHTKHSVVIAALLLYALLFVLLSLDVSVRVWHWRDRFDAPLDVAVLLFFEGLRTVVTLAGIAVTLTALGRAAARPPLVWLAYATAFTTIACTKLLAYDSFPGAVQEHAAVALLSAGIPRWVLQVIFARWEWTAWLALGAFVRLTAAWPRALTGGDVHAAGGRDRAGALRGVAVAGMDVGQVLRGWTAALADAGWLHSGRLAAITVLLAAVHTLVLLTASGLVALAANVAASIAAGVMAGVGVTLFRAGWSVADSAQRPFMRWLRRGASSALTLFGLSAFAALVGAGLLSSAALLLAPAGLFTCAFQAVREAQEEAFT